MPLVVDFRELGIGDVQKVGGKNASIGEMISKLHSRGIKVPEGFATTDEAYSMFLEQGDLGSRIESRLKQVDVADVQSLMKLGKEIRQDIIDTPFPGALEDAISGFYSKISSNSVAVRSSASVEDLPDASFAGQQETFLNIQGLDAVLDAVKRVFASLYNDRAISYRAHRGFKESNIFLSAAVQRMVRAEASGVLFTLDTESGFDGIVFITSSYGLGELVVQGAVNPDEFYVYKKGLVSGKYPIIRKAIGSKKQKMVFSDNPRAGLSLVSVPVPLEDQRRFSINDDEIKLLSRCALSIEEHYGRAMDVEWAKDEVDGEIYILQARPETVQSKSLNTITRYEITSRSEVLIEGRAIGQQVGSGKVRILRDVSQMDQLGDGEILVAEMTDPDWEPIMKRASAIVTDRGGRTCHAAIIARELGIPAIVGSNDATSVLRTGQDVTVSCAEGDTGFVYEGILDVKKESLTLDKMPEIPVRIMMNVGNPSLAFNFCKLPNFGVGLARMEFIINNQVGVHPKALIEFSEQRPELKNEILQRSAGYDSPTDFYISKIAEGVSTLAAAFFPSKVIVRLSDFKTNEYANLVGGRAYENPEENPMLGFRGVSRYLSNSFVDCFELECRAIRRVREEMGFENVEIMVPFVRTLSEAEKVTKLLENFGLKRGVNGLKVIMMCELPANALLADKFLDYFDGFSIGSNDMTQLTLGLDRDSGGQLGASFDERDPAVKMLLEMAIKACRERGKYIGICGQGPSDYPDFAEWLFDQKIETISLNPDTVVKTWLHLAGMTGA